MSYDVADYSDYEYEQYVYWGGREADDGFMDDKYGRGQWSKETAVDDRSEGVQGG